MNPVSEIWDTAKFSPSNCSGIDVNYTLTCSWIKPEPCPEPEYSPIIIARQQIFSRKRRRVLRRASHDARAVSPFLPRLLFPPVRNVETSILRSPEKVGFWISRALRALVLFLC